MLADILKNYIQGFQLSWVSNTTLALTTGEAQAGAASFIVSTGALAINLATVGAGGLDVGALAANKQYAVWVMQGTGGITAVASLSFTLGGLTVPAAFAVDARRVGSFLSDPAVARVNFFRQSGLGQNREMDMSASYPGYNNYALTNGHATVLSPVDCSAFVPPTATDAWVFAAVGTSGTGGNALCYMGDDSTGATSDDGIFLQVIAGVAVTGGVAVQTFWQALDALKKFAYYFFTHTWTSQGLTVQILGYREALT